MQPATDAEWAWAMAASFWLIHEGGLVDHPDDPGGLTKYGIAQRFHPDVDIRELTVEQAVEILRADYWLPNRCDEIATAGPLTAWALFDYAGNGSADAARRALQREIGARPDGVLGPDSMKALEEHLAHEGDRGTALALVKRRARRQMVRVRQGASSPAFLVGWVNRFLDLTAAIAAAQPPKEGNR